MAEFGAYVHNNILICFQKAIAQRWRWYENEPQHNHKNNNNINIIMSCGSVIGFIAKYYSLVLRLPIIVIITIIIVLCKISRANGNYIPGNRSERYNRCQNNTAVTILIITAVDLMAKHFFLIIM